MAWYLPDMRHWRLTALAAATLLYAGCGNFGYYMQSIHGQMGLLQARQPIADVLADPSTPPDLKARLERVVAIREYASRELHLPDNQGYRGYADLRRPFVVWNVFAAGEFSVEPRQWCFLFAGCVGYRGYFAQADAAAFAREQRAAGLETYVGGVPAYSTLGWFDDPVLNTFINYPEYELVRLIFHELAHQVVYIKGDSEFNESFAAAVELEGVRRWIAQGGDARMSTDFERSQQRRAQFSGMALEYRDTLAALYRSGMAPGEMRARKAQIYAEMKQDYAARKSQWGGFSGYDRILDGVNNAYLASIAIYHARVPQFQSMIARHGGDFVAFYAAVRALAALPKEARRAALEAGGPVPTSSHQER